MSKQLFNSKTDRARAQKLLIEIRHNLRSAKRQDGAQLLATLENIEGKIKAVSRCFSDPSQPVVWNSTPPKEMHYRARYI